MKSSKILSLLVGIVLTVTVITVIYTQRKPVTEQLLVSEANTGAIREKITAVSKNTDYSNLINHLQERESQFLDTIEEKFATINNDFKYIGTQVEGLVERINILELNQEHHDFEPSTAPTNASSDTDHNSTLASIEAQQTFLQSLEEKFIAEQEEKFIAEQIDNNWSITAKDDIQSLFLSQENPVYQTSHLTAIECRSNSCKVNVAHDLETEAEDFESEFIIDAGKAGFSKVRGYYDVQNGVNTATYFVIQQAPQSPNDHSHN